MFSEAPDHTFNTKPHDLIGRPRVGLTSTPNHNHQNGTGFTLFLHLLGVITMAFWEVVLNGFTCEKATWDDALNWDGWADEVFIRSSAQVQDKSGNVKVPTASFFTASRVMGDAPYPDQNRIRAGAATSHGGITTKNSVPPVVDPWAQRGAPTPDGIPLLLWRGPLSATTSVAISPVIWEWDPGVDVVTGIDNWFRTHESAVAAAAAAISTVASDDQTTTSGDSWAAFVKALGTVVSQVSDFLGHQGSRPIGTTMDSAGMHFEPKTVILDETRASALRSHNTVIDGVDYGPGIIPIDYRDSDNIGGGFYRLFLEVRKTGDDLPDGTVMSDVGSGKYSVTAGGAAFALPDSTAVAHYTTNPAVDATKVPVGTVAAMTSIPRDGTIVREWSSSNVYRIENGAKRRFTSLDALTEQKVTSADLRLIPDGGLSAMASGPDIDASPRPIPVSLPGTDLHSLDDSFVHSPVPTPFADDGTVGARGHRAGTSGTRTARRPG